MIKLVLIGPGNRPVKFAQVELPLSALDGEKRAVKLRKEDDPVH